TVIGTVSDGPGEGRAALLARRARRDSHGKNLRGDRLPADSTGFSRDRSHGGEAIRAYREPGNLRERQAAETAIGGEKRSEEAFGESAGSGNRRPQLGLGKCPGTHEKGVLRRSGYRGASYVSDTAEDQPPSYGAWLGSSRTNCIQYSGSRRRKQFAKRHGA